MNEIVSGSFDAPAARTHVHTRSVEYRGYRRDDGLWDIEADLTDAKTYTHATPDRGILHAGEPVHMMAIRVTVDDAMKIADIAVGMPSAPFPDFDGPVAKRHQPRFAGWRPHRKDTAGT
jgi:hypothetical protein